MTVREYISQCRSSTLPTAYDLSFRTYDWSLSGPSRGEEVPARASREMGSGLDGQARPTLQTFTAATLVDPGPLDIETFNNLCTQTALFDGEGQRVSQHSRSTFFTSTLAAFAGVTPTLNPGAQLFFKSVRNDSPDSSRFQARTFESRPKSRTNLTAIAPQARYAPPVLGGTTRQFTLLVPLSQNFDGAKSDQPFPSRRTPRTGHRPSTTCPFSAIGFYSFWSPVSSAASTSVRHGTTNSNHELTVPVKSILSYCPTDRVTLYGLAEVAPKENRNWNGGDRFAAGTGSEVRDRAGPAGGRPCVHVSPRHQQRGRHDVQPRGPLSCDNCASGAGAGPHMPPICLAPVVALLDGALVPLSAVKRRAVHRPSTPSHRRRPVRRTGANPTGLSAPVSRRPVRPALRLHPDRRGRASPPPR